MKTVTRKSSFLFIFLIYLLSFIACCFLFNELENDSVLFKTLLCTAAATMIVWFFGIIFKNSSVYDPYWSVQPMVIVSMWFIIRGTPFLLTDILVLLAIFVWGIRLTWNWAVTFKGLQYQDWRYSMIKENNLKMWFFSNLFGINMMPTLLVYAGIVPVYYIIFNPSEFSVLFLFGFIVSIMAPVISFISDQQLRSFRKENHDTYIFTGLWKFSRHPNYLGEITFWWGVFLMQMGLIGRPVITIAGPLMITLLFIFISIPMMEKHMMRKHPEYLDYQKNVPLLKFNFFRKA
ncbi:MAG: DUF1295 domain-containing protein [Clostridia bacterium]|nr:DUF1295 domain-containing protein [Clostridia bacterium]